ncbi:uncharacterized protein K444DRAFT_80678 [Hyaloscypha bicolor E]|uniref:Uncharacterized protein n=1 Tax=Hyaloscypha bicolor E TaxID=1095630 RepID=A0A2J6SYF3_9HELO|nr:uncharacterized protein K444DRAFT_80678 [Hyaloscypha bicolor E]PMD55808.1 hypothetical protein K444DRAFT_80678 [Hyaloscypha bicolor E]
MLAVNASTVLDTRDKYGPQDLPPGHHVWCSCGSILDGTSYNNARTQLSDKFHQIKTKNKLSGGDDITIVVRDVVAFACSEADQGGSLRIGAWWLTLFTRSIQKLCGDHSTGTYWIFTGGHAVMYGFKHDDGKDACSNVPALSPNTCNHPPLKDESPMPPEDKRSTSNVTSGLGTRDVHTHCGCGFNMDESAAKNAVDTLRKQVDKNRYLASVSTTGISGGVIAFICIPVGFVSQKVYVDPDKYDYYFKEIKGACWEIIAGTYSDSFGAEGDINYGYMRYSPGMELRVCDNPASASAQNCPK